MRVLPRVGPVWFAALAVLVVATGVLPVAFAAASGRLVGTVASLASRRAVPAAEIVGVVMPAAILYVLSELAEPLQSAALHPLGFRLARELRDVVMRATLAPSGIAHLEDPRLADELAVVKEIGEQPTRAIDVVESFASLVSTRLQGIGAALILCRLNWWTGLLLAGAWLPLPLAARRELDRVTSSTEADAALRRSHYFRDLAAEAAPAKEVRVFGLAGWLLDRSRLHWERAMRSRWSIRFSGGRDSALLFVPVIVAYVLVFWWLLRAGVAGRVGPGELAVALQAALLTRRLGIPGWWQSELDGAVAAARALRLAKLNAPDAELDGAASADGLPRSSIRFQDVSFAYPGTSKRVLDGLDLEVPAGRSLAIVGLNGAGKTTLIKLLGRLYDCDAGRILVDGIDIASLDAPSWRSRLAVIFQDYVKYELSARDNIGFGDLEILERDEELARVARAAGADGLVESWDTVLSRAYDGGVDLSGGEWQRIAIARALAATGRGASVLVMDEPTANLDVRAEAEIFDRVLDLTRGLTTILISHRFSTVRRADSICVLEGGRVVERGTHDELIASGGRYAAMFELQASRFQGARAAPAAREDRRAADA
jgi:ATP-binding cassette subfamily B protein